ncbi:MAG: hypothetical protein CL878_05175 [Dehalococcoidia bacterium]|nr:hypothetical protein [Dehalococcoidia bacterium]
MPIGPTNPITSWLPPPPAPVLPSQALANQAALGAQEAGQSAGVGGTSSVANATTAANELGQDAFLKLLIAQLRNQDPLRPMEDREFIAQLAQFNTLEQMQGMNQSLREMLTIQSLSEASGLIGRDVISRLLDDAGGFVEGTVTAVAVVNGSPTLLVGPDRVPVAIGDVMGVRRSDQPSSAGSAPLLGATTGQQGSALGDSQNAPAGSPVANSPFFSTSSAASASSRGTGALGGASLQPGSGLTSSQSLGTPPGYPVTGSQAASGGSQTP